MPDAIALCIASTRVGDKYTRPVMHLNMHCMQQQTAMQRTEDYELRHHRKDGSQQVLHSTLSMTQLELHMYGDVPRPGGADQLAMNDGHTIHSDKTACYTCAYITHYISKSIWAKNHVVGDTNDHNNIRNCYDIAC